MNILIYPDPKKEKITHEKRWCGFGNFKDDVFKKIKDTEVESLSKLYEKNKNINTIFIFRDDYCKFIFNNINFILNTKNIKFYIAENDIHFLKSKKNTYNRYLSLRNNLENNNHIYIMTSCWYYYIKLYKIDINNVIKLPLHANNRKIEINYNPTMKVLLSGSMSSSYPMRRYLKSLNLPNVYFLNSAKRMPLKEYEEFISQFICSFTCCLNPSSPYIVGKFFEIPLTGSLLLAYDEHVKEPLKELGFIDGINYISVTKKNIISKINWICDVKNINTVNKMRKRGQDLILNNHTIKHRYETLKNIVA